ncbi:MAG: SNF2-related protein, partial [Clostridia bacterium]|nr:SNF2-related protein [Clostridia bacterium]
MFQRGESPKTIQDFLKREYGTSGHSHTFLDGSSGFVDYRPGQGMKLSRSATGEEIIVKWTAMEKHLRVLVATDRYLTAEEKQKYDEQREAVEPFTSESDLDVDQSSSKARPVAADEQMPDATEALPPIAHPDALPYVVGDVLYLEDGKPFILESIRPFDISLRDPALLYPIIRSESKESLLRLLERYPQPEREPAHDGQSRETQLEETENAAPAIAIPPPENFRITDDRLGVGGAKTKYAANVTAIRLLQTLEQEGRTGNPDEQEVLSRYVGWGGIPQAFDDQNANWSREYAELKSLLSDSEYISARASTLNAHYTSPVVIKAIYEAIERMGFGTGNILEPACGVGNFFGLLPESMAGSNLYGVELDSITGRIAMQLYPQANITVSGFEKTDQRDFFDIAIGNVPFGSYQVSDKAYDKLGFLIHDYFFAKTLDQVRPGGVVAFITSKGTMDKQSPEVRRYLAQRAELLGAVRLPNNAFKANAGTEVTSDILFLQKRDRPIVIEPDWVHLGTTEDGIPVNSYFADNPEMVLGNMVWDDTMYGKHTETACLPVEGEDLSEQLSQAMVNIRGEITEAELPDLGEGEAIDASLPADPNVRNFSYTLVDGEVYYRENSRMVRPELNATAKERVRSLVEMRDCVRELIDRQMIGASDSFIRETQQRLSSLYEGFTGKYGLINSRGNANTFSDDSSYYLLCSLEILDENGALERKADMFTKRTIRPAQAVEHVDTASEALALSIAEKARVDIAYMERLTGMSWEELASDLRGVVFQLPAIDVSEPMRYVAADEYLSGNIREKLEAAKRAAEADSRYLPNVEALEKAMPKELDASEIDVRLGATWIEKSYIQSFMEELLEPPSYLRDVITVNYSPVTAEWNISSKSSISSGNVAAYATYGTDRASAYRILEETLNLRDIRIYDTVYDADGKEKRVLNPNATTLAQQKQQVIKDAFRDWVWKDADRRQALVERYNVMFNSTRPREYNGKHITFSGMNPEIVLHHHQRDAIAHILYGGNTLLAHEVGAGKTFEMVAACMESKRLGLSQKALFAVPNHLTEQWASEFLRLYPSANILVATKKDFETKNRKKFCARIATGDYDAVIMGHSQFERIPISQERQKRYLYEQISEIEAGIEELKEARAERFTIKQMERTRKQLETRLEKLMDTERKDDVVTFEELGVDRLYVDEAHSYKNLFLYTKMRNVAGLSTSDAQKSSDMLLKCRYINEIPDNKGKGIVFATGTPVSNSMTELFTMMRY